MAASLKAADRGETIASDPAGKIAAARQKNSITFAVVIKIEMSWATIRATSEVGIAEFILKQMRGSREAVN